MLDNMKLSQKIMILPVLAALGFVLVLAISVTASNRSDSVHRSLRNDEVRAIVSDQDAAAWDRFTGELDRADDIVGRVATIQSDTQRAIDAISGIGEVVRSIHDIQTTIATAVEEQSATASEIGRNVTEAATGSSEIARNVAGVASAARSTSNGAATTLEAAVQLGENASRLEATLAHFTFSPTTEV